MNTLNKKKNGLINKTFEYDLQLFAYRIVTNPYPIDPLSYNCKSKADVSSSYNYDGVYGPIPDENGMVNLSRYAQYYIPNYRLISKIPQENLDYLNSGLVASDVSYLFNYCQRLLTLPKLDINIYNCSSLVCAFNECSSMTTINLSNWDTSNITDMESVFTRAFDSDTTYINISGWDTSKVTNMALMFQGGYSLEHIEGIIDMSSCTTYINLFANCDKLTGVKIKNPPQEYYDNKASFESKIDLSSSQYEIVS